MGHGYPTPDRSGPDPVTAEPSAALVAAEIIAGRQPCWTLRPKYCATHANGRPRCTTGSCLLLDSPKADT